MKLLKKPNFPIESDINDSYLEGYVWEDGYGWIDPMDPPLGLLKKYKSKEWKKAFEAAQNFARDNLIKDPNFWKWFGENSLDLLKDSTKKDGLPITDLINTLGEKWALVSLVFNTPITTSALDEMGHPIMQANGEISTMTATPKLELSAATMGIALPLSVWAYGVPATLTTLGTGFIGDKVGGTVGKYTAKALGGNEEALNMFEDLGSFSGSMLFGGKGFNFATKEAPTFFYKTLPLSLSGKSKFTYYNIINTPRTLRWILKLPPYKRAAYFRDLKNSYLHTNETTVAGKTPLFEVDVNSAYYKNLVKMVGEEKAALIIELFKTPEFQLYFIGDTSLENASQQIGDFEHMRNIHSHLGGDPADGKGTLLGSASVSLYGTLHRDTAVSHDLDYKAYAHDPTYKEPDLSPEGRAAAKKAMFTDYEFVPKAGIVLRINKLYGYRPTIYVPGRMSRWFMPSRKDNAFYATRMFNVTNPVSAYRTVQTEIEGIPIDLFLTKDKIEDKNISFPEEALFFKRKWTDDKIAKGLEPRAKDVSDLHNYAAYGPDNPVIDPQTGEGLYAPFRFGPHLTSKEGYPVVLMLETYDNSGLFVPVTMNWKGLFKKFKKGGNIK